MAKEKTQRNNTASTLALALAAGAFALSAWNTMEQKQVGMQLADLSASLEAEKHGLRFASKDAFDEAVVANIDNYIAEKQGEEIDRKYAAYAAAAEEVPDGKWFYGNLDARFTLVEFSDLECPYCKRFHETPKSIVDASNGNVNWQWKHLPLGFHNPAAKHEAHAAECVGEQKGNRGFWVFVDEIFKNTKGNGEGVSSVAALAAGIGADLDQFQECMSSNRYADKIAADMQQASQSGVNGTPATFIVDNHTGRSQLLGGAQPPEAFFGAIRKMIAEAKAEESSGTE